MNTIKLYLLNSNIFEDNSYLDAYCELIIENKFTKKESFKTQTHHILPRFYFKVLKLPVDNSFGNLVELSLTDHILAHYYLSCCTIGEFKQKACGAFKFMWGLPSLVQSVEELKESLDKVQEILEIANAEHLRQAHQTGKLNANRVYLKKGNTATSVNKSEVDLFLAKGWTLGSLANSKRVGCKMMTDGTTTVLAYTSDDIKKYQELGFSLGRHFKPALGRRQSQQEKETRSKKMKGKHTNRIHITNGIKNKFVFESELVEYLQQGWYRGRVMKNMKNLNKEI